MWGDDFPKDVEYFVIKKRNKYRVMWNRSDKRGLTIIALKNFRSRRGAENHISMLKGQQAR